MRDYGETNQSLEIVKISSKIRGQIFFLVKVYIFWLNLSFNSARSKWMASSIYAILKVLSNQPNRKQQRKNWLKTLTRFILYFGALFKPITNRAGGMQATWFACEKYETLKEEIDKVAKWQTRTTRNEQTRKLSNKECNACISYGWNIIQLTRWFDKWRRYKFKFCTRNRISGFRLPSI